MRNRMVLMIMAMTTFAAFGLLLSGIAYAEQSTTSPAFSLQATSAAASPFTFMLVKDGHGGKHMGSSHKGMSHKGMSHKGMSFHHGGHHGFHHGYRHHGGYWPYYSDYGSSCYTCYWDGYQRVCYNTCSDYDEF